MKKEVTIFQAGIIGDALYTPDTKVTQNITLTVHWTPHEYSITYAGVTGAENPNTVTKYTIESDDIVLKAPSKNGREFIGWKKGNDFVTKIPKGGYTEDIILYAEWNALSDVENPAGVFTYYKGSDGAWYAKAQERASENDNFTYSDGTKVGRKSENYFKVEPVKWRVPTDNYSGKKLLLSESVLSMCYYYDTDSDFAPNRIIDGKTVLAGNYEYSNVRSYLNKEFLQTAFSASELAKIATVIVDNSIDSAKGAGYSYTVCDIFTSPSTYPLNNTEDKVFLLSAQEVTTQAYGFDKLDVKDSVRIKKSTDFAKVHAAHTGDDGCMWWLRSPDLTDKNGDYVENIFYDGYECSSLRPFNYSGVVPALCLK